MLRTCAQCCDLSYGGVLSGVAYLPSHVLVFPFFFAPSSLTYFIFSSKPDAPLDWTQPELLI